jgi:glycosyltransferase involved in cell wall biosynthesis
MRILVIHNRYQQAGGEDAIVRQETDLLRRYGHSVELLLFDNEEFSSSLGKKIRGAVLSINNPTSARRVADAIRTFRPDVVHIHNLFYTASPAIIDAAKRWNVPVVMTLHNYRLVCNSSLLMRPAELACERCLTKTLPLDGIRHGCFRGSRLQSAQLTALTSLHKLTGTWQRVDKYIALTEFARQKFLHSSLRLAPEQIVVKPNAVPELGFSPPADRTDTYLYVGRLTVDKGVRVLLEAFRHTPHSIDIVGDGPLRGEVEAAAAACPTIRYHGPLDRAEVVTYLKRCRALVLPSLWYEGLPTVLLEAYATGTPVLCSDQQNLNQLVLNGQTGQLFQTGSAVSLLHALQTLTPEQAARYGRAAYAQWQDHYTEQANYEQLVRAYESVLERKTVITPRSAPV